MEIIPLGDSALIVRVREKFENTPEKTLSAVLTAQQHLEAARLPGAIELAPAYTTIAFFYNPAAAVDAGAPADDIFGWYEKQIRVALSSVAGVGDPGHGQRQRALPIEISVCYADEFAPDLNDVAQHAGISTEQVVDLHCSPEYRVHCVGFTAGFPFLGGLPSALATPRRATPRKEIPAGSVGIGGAQTGIYPVKSPGGWNIIGRTPVRLFDPQKNPPSLLRAGDRVQFRSITHAEFERLTHDARSTVLSS